MDPLALSLADVSHLLREGRLTSLALTRLCLERIAALDARLNAFITLTADSALREAAEADRLIAEGRYFGPLHGVLIAIKDLIDIAGVRTTAASRVLSENIAPEDAPVVTRLRRAGAVILGKLNLHEFAYGGSGMVSAYGPAVNPLDPPRTTGGSSSGSATAVAAHMCFAALGTDTAGSIRVPAACCGLVGFKPTWGAVSTEGVIPLSASYDHVGPIARTVEDARLVFEAIANDGAGDGGVNDSNALPPPHVLRDEPRATIGVARKFFCEELDPEVAAAFEADLAKLSAFAALVEVDVSVDTDRALAASEAFAYHRQFLAEKASLYDERTLARIMTGKDITVEAVSAARSRLRELRRQAGIVFANVDAIVTPTMPLAPPPVRELADAANLRPLELRMLRNTRPFNVLGWPTITLPGASLGEHLRAGLQLSGAPGRDRELLVLAQRVEAALGVPE